MESYASTGELGLQMGWSYRLESVWGFVLGVLKG